MLTVTVIFSTQAISLIDSVVIDVQWRRDMSGFTPQLSSVLSFFSLTFSSHWWEFLCVKNRRRHSVLCSNSQSMSVLRLQVRMQPVVSILLATLVGFGLTMSATTGVVEFSKWRRRHRTAELPSSSQVDQPPVQTTDQSMSGSRNWNQRSWILIMCSSSRVWYQIKPFRIKFSGHLDGDIYI